MSLKVDQGSCKVISESLGEIIPSMIPYKKSYVLSEKGVSIHWPGLLDLFVQLALQHDHCCEANLPQVSMINLPVHGIWSVV